MLRFACEARWAGLGNDSFYCSKNGYALMSDLNPGPTQVERRDALGLDANVNEVGLAPTTHAQWQVPPLPSS